MNKTVNLVVSIKYKCFKKMTYIFKYGKLICIIKTKEKIYCVEKILFIDVSWWVFQWINEIYNRKKNFKEYINLISSNHSITITTQFSLCLYKNLYKIFIYTFNRYKKELHVPTILVAMKQKHHNVVFKRLKIGF